MGEDGGSGGEVFAGLKGRYLSAMSFHPPLQLFGNAIFCCNESEIIDDPIQKICEKDVFFAQHLYNYSVPHKSFLRRYSDGG